MAAFVLGNGVSRRGIDPDWLLDHGAVYGCNALYRNHAPTVLVATDKPIADEIQQSGYALTNRFYTRRPLPNLNAHLVPQQYFGFSSGPIAMAIAAQDGQTPIYLLGFDLAADNGRFNNVYASTEFYKSQTSQPTYTGNWIRQMIRVIKDYKTTRFIRVHGATTGDISEFGTLENLETLELSAFLMALNKPKDL